jgi:hypothetical protein
VMQGRRKDAPSACPNDGLALVKILGHQQPTGMLHKRELCGRLNNCSVVCSCSAGVKMSEKDSLPFRNLKSIFLLNSTAFS